MRIIKEERFYTAEVGTNARDVGEGNVIELR